MRRREGNGPNEDDWLAEEDWVEAPTEEMSSPPGRRPRARPQRPQPPPGMPSRRMLGIVAAVSILLLIILVAVLQSGDDSADESESPPTTTTQTTAPTTESAAALRIPESGTLSEGDSGQQVRRLQRALAELGYDVAPDGAFGPSTTAAVQAFQEDAGLDADGVAGPATARAINEALAERG
jgi:Putative peptidoglycan binding domain